MVSKKDHSKCKNAVRSAIRQSFTRSEHYKNFLATKRIEWVEGKRKRVSYRCENCSRLIPGKEVNVDHIQPIGKGVYNDIGDAEYFYKLVFCSYDNLQILCNDPCHKEKSARERKAPSFLNAQF